MKILIVEDEKDLNKAICKGLKNKGFTVDSSYDGKQGLKKALINEYDVIIFDLNLPKLDGINAVKNLRNKDLKTPIIALTARDKLKDKIKGFENGFDDYLTKPFDFPELIIRINALIRRTKPNKEIILKINDLKLNPKTRKVTKKNKSIKLTKKEFNLFEYLLRNKGKVVTNEEIIEHIWGESADLLNPPIRSHIKNIRKKINDEDFNLIKTIPGVGYKI